MSRRIRFDYPSFVGMEIGFSNSISPVGCVIRAFTGGVKNTFDRTTPNHALFITEDHGQFFATEETLTGLKENSLEGYTGSANRMVEIWRWDGFRNAVTRERAYEFLAEIRRKDKEESKYDFLGALRASKAGRALGFKNNPKRDFCSENVFRVLVYCGLQNYPKGWIVNPPNPLELARWFKSRPDFRTVNGLMLPAIGNAQDMEALEITHAGSV